MKDVKESKIKSNLSQICKVTSDRTHCKSDSEGVRKSKFIVG